MNVNVKYKDSVFSFLFSDPVVLRELYSAIEGVEIPPDTPIEINTLSDILYMDQVNDISFTIDNRLVVLIEHQSTINQNMPLRLLLYIARIYEKITDRKRLYNTKLEKIPTPEFIVLYNGKTLYPDHTELKLSEAFINADDLRKNRTLPLELTVQVYNINHGRNPELLKKSETLNGYSFFIKKVRKNYKELLPKHEKTKEALRKGVIDKIALRNEAIKMAIEFCINHGILKEFLETHSSEVFNMLLTDWNWDDAKEVWQEEAYEDGFEEGREEGLEEGREAVARNALAKGLSIEFVHEITGLSLEMIEKLKAEI